MCRSSSARFSSLFLCLHLVVLGTFDAVSTDTSEPIGGGTWGRAEGSDHPGTAGGRDVDSLGTAGGRDIDGPGTAGGRAEVLDFHTLTFPLVSSNSGSVWGSDGGGRGSVGCIPTS